MNEPNTALPVWDEAALLKRVMGKAELKDKLLGIFLKELPSHLAAVQQASLEKDLSSLMKASHALKGMAGTISALKLHAVMADLEQAARSGELERAIHLQEGVDVLVDELVIKLQQDP